MIKENEFDTLVEKSRQFAYSSMNYLDFEDCENAHVLQNDSQLILLLDESSTPPMLYFATDNFEKVVDEVANIPGDLRLHFVPRAFARQLEALGFVEWGEYFDFFNTDLPGTAALLGDIDAVEYLQPNECEAAAALSQRCRLQSRGFEGETAAWFASWLKENPVIVVRQGAALAGFCCVSIYNKGTALWIREIAVDPAFQGLGFGKQLMAQAIAYGAKHGAVKGFMHVDVLNKNAIGLYDKFGFRSQYKDGELQMIRSEKKG